MGREQAGLRPVLVFSGNTFNENKDIVIIIPLTSRLKNFYGGIILTPTDKNGLTETSEVLTFHIRSISTERLVRKIGSISQDELSEISRGLEDILTL